MSNEEKAKELSKILKYLAIKIEKYPELVENLNIQIKYSEVNKTTNQFDIYKYKDENELVPALKHYNIESLRQIIKNNNLDRNKESGKIKTKNELIKFIEKKIYHRYHRGESFME